MNSDSGYKIVRLSSGAHSVYSLADQEAFHPGIGPAAEAEALYVQQLHLPERVQAAAELVIWDVGLGAAANALTAIRLIRDHLATLQTTVQQNQSPKRVRIVSFDQTTVALEFALQHVAELDYLSGFQSITTDLIKNRCVIFSDAGLEVNWSLQIGDFPNLLADRSFGEAMQNGGAPHAILFDPHSPKKNPAMWTVAVFSNLFLQLDPEQPCNLANFTRSTMARAAMLLGGFFVGIGRPTGLKEETTVAANQWELLDEPLDRHWLERARRSYSAEPLWDPVYRQAPLFAETLRKLEQHPQFR